MAEIMRFGERNESECLPPRDSEEADGGLCREKEESGGKIGSLLLAEPSGNWTRDRERVALQQGTQLACAVDRCSTASLQGFLGSLASGFPSGDPTVAKPSILPCSLRSTLWLHQLSP